MSPPFSIAVHGGAGRLAAADTHGPGRRAYDAAVARALEAGAVVLRDGGPALEAVCAAVVVLEDEERFNAARGATLCRDGSVELGAAVMDGQSRAVGAVVGARRIRNPVRAARALLDHEHCLLFGAHADAYAETAGVPLAPASYFVTDARRRQWERLGDRTTAALGPDGDADEHGHGTVGAVARDRSGGLAAATSTGGMVNQLPGRVGDSPVAGAGTWADAHCAVSATGTGDHFLRVAFARRVADRMELGGLGPREAAERALAEVRSIGGRGGCIVVDAAGRVATAMNSPHMVRGVLTDGGPARLAIGPEDLA